MEENQEHKISFFTRVKWAIFNLENYDFFAVENPRKAFAYFAKLILVFCMLICIAITYRFASYYQNAVNYIKNDMPEFSYKEGELYVEQEEPIFQENENGIIIIETTLKKEEAEELIKKLQNYQTGILLLKDKVMLKLPLSEEATTYSYQEIVSKWGMQSFTKADIVLNVINQVPDFMLYSVFYVISVIYLFMVYFIIIAIDVILLSILGVLTSRMIRIKLRYMPIVNLSIYSLTLPILLNAIYIMVNAVTGFEIQYFQIMYNAISYIYLVTAILMIKTEMLKQEMELIKLAEEQKKVKEELERKQEEEREKELQKKKEKQDEEKKKQKEEKKEEGNAPEGSA